MKKLLTIVALLVFFGCTTKDECTINQPDEPTMYELKVSSSNGGIISTDGGIFESGSSIDLIATTNQGYQFDGWEGYDSNKNSVAINLNSGLSNEQKLNYLYLEGIAPIQIEIQKRR
ncbi:MAG: hypothetical protein L7U59_08135 [Flavobacteriaceae bacterium]|nr:hypothetical protein [Flavobacteriaceae bacterium]